jgi:membrane protein
MIEFFKARLLPLGKLTFEKWQRDECPERATSLAYYALFSIFPLLLVALSVVGALLGRNAVAQAEVLRLAGQALPPEAFSTVSATLEQFIAQSGNAGLIGFGVLLLSASGFFGALDRTFDVIWEARTHAPMPSGWLARGLTVLHQRAVAFALVLASVPLVLLSMLGNLTVGVAAAVAEEAGGAAGLVLDRAVLAQTLGAVVTAVGLLLLLALIYRLLPSVPVAWGDVWLGAGVGAGALLLLQRLVVGGVINLGASYQSYGVIGGVMLLLFWIYLTAQVLLLGAEICYAYAHLFGSQRAPTEAAPPPAPVLQSNERAG